MLGFYILKTVLYPGLYPGLPPATPVLTSAFTRWRTAGSWIWMLHEHSNHLLEPAWMLGSRLFRNPHTHRYTHSARLSVAPDLNFWAGAQIQSYPHSGLIRERLKTD